MRNVSVITTISPSALPESSKSMNFIIEEEFDELFGFDEKGRKLRTPRNPQQVSTDPLNKFDLNAYTPIASFLGRFLSSKRKEEKVKPMQILGILATSFADKSLM